MIVQAHAGQKDARRDRNKVGHKNPLAEGIRSRGSKQALRFAFYNYIYELCEAMHEIKFGNYLENTSAEMKIEVLEAKKIFLEEVSELKREEVLEVLKDLSKNGIGKNVRFYAKMEFEARKGKE